MTAITQYFSLVLFTILYKVILGFESVNESRIIHMSAIRTNLWLLFVMPVKMILP